MYLTIYEFNEPGDLEEFDKDPLMVPAKKYFEEEAPKCLEMYWAGFYEPVKTYDKGK
jgi:hypothetical protein